MKYLQHNCPIIVTLFIFNLMLEQKKQKTMYLCINRIWFVSIRTYYTFKETRSIHYIVLHTHI